MALRDDLNIPEAMAVVFDLVNQVNPALSRNQLSRTDANALLEFLNRADRVLGFIAHDKGSLDSEVEKLIAEREEARRSRNYARADEIRDELLRRGIVLEDTVQGTRWRRSFE